MAATARQIDSLRARGITITVLEMRGIRRLKYPQSLPRLLRLAAGADLVHAHYGYCGWLARFQLGRPVVVSFMGDDILGTPDASGRVGPRSKAVVALDRRLARLVDAVIVKSAEMAEVVAPVEAHVIPNGVDVELFRPREGADAKRRLGWDDDRRRVLFAGNPATPRKGFPLAREAVSEAARCLADDVELVPLAGVAPDRVPLYMNACDALLLTSFLEGSPNVAKEAMACNLPVVSVPVGDVRALIEDVEACSVRPRDARALGEALACLLAARVRSNGRAALYRKGLTLDRVAQRVVAVYEEVVARRQQQPSHGEAPAVRASEGTPHAGAR